MEELEKESEGMSTGKKVAAGAAIGVAVPAAYGVAKKFLGNGDTDDQEQDGQSRTGSRAARSTRSASSTKTRRSRTRASTRAKSSSRPRSSTRSSSKRGSSSSSSRSGSTRTKEQLYNQAKRLKIEGRSSMNKAQLERAISRKRS
jgi:hypothetical protein